MPSVINQINQYFPVHKRPPSPVQTGAACWGNVWLPSLIREHNKFWRRQTSGRSLEWQGSSFELMIHPFNQIVRSDLIPMLGRVVHVGQRFINPGFYLFGGGCELHLLKLLRHSLCFYVGCILVFLAVDGLEHPVYYRYFPCGMTENTLREKCTVQRWYFAFG